MDKKLEALLKLKDKHIADTQAGNPPSEDEVMRVRQHLRAVQAAIEATAKVEMLEKELPLITSNPVTNNNVAVTSNKATATSTSTSNPVAVTE